MTEFVLGSEWVLKTEYEEYQEKLRTTPRRCSQSPMELGDEYIETVPLPHIWKIRKVYEKTWPGKTIPDAYVSIESTKNKTAVFECLQEDFLRLYVQVVDSWKGLFDYFDKIGLPYRFVKPQLMTQEIVSIEPMPLPSGLLFWLDFTYGTKNDRT